MKIHIGIIGSRRRDSDKDLQCLVDFITPHIEYYDKEGFDIVFVSGHCSKGGDRFAEILAEMWDIPIILHKPDKSNLPDEPKTKDFRRINFARNSLIARDSEVLIALVAEDRLGGTENTIRTFNKLHPRGFLYII